MDNKQFNTSKRDSKQSISRDGKLQRRPTLIMRFIQISLYTLLIASLMSFAVSIMHLDDKTRSNIWKMETGLNLPLLLPMLKQDSAES